TGLTGLQGVAGATGPAGPSGPPGGIGATGPQGSQGPSGVRFDRSRPGPPSITPIDGPTAGLYTSLTVGTDGLGLISYYDLGDADLKVAHCANVTCSSATRTTVDSAGRVGLYTSVTV